MISEIFISSSSYVQDTSFKYIKTNTTYTFENKNNFIIFLLFKFYKIWRE